MPMADRDEKRNNRGMDTLFSGILMLLAAALLLLANLYTTELWPVKAALALLLTGTGVAFCWRFVSSRRGRQ